MAEDFGIVDYQPSHTQMIQMETDDPFAGEDANEIKEIEKEPKNPKDPKSPSTKKEDEKKEKEDKKIDPYNQVIEDDSVKEEEPPVQKDEQNDDNVNPFTVYSDALYEMGIFVPEIDENGEEVRYQATSEDELKEMWQIQARSNASNFLEEFLSSRGNDVKAIFEALYYDGVDPRSYLPTAKNLQDFSTIDLKIEGNAERVVREGFRRQGYSDEQINKKVDRLRALSELDNEAEDVLPVLIEGDKQKLAALQQEAKQKEQQAIENDKSYKQSLTRILSEKIKAKDFDGIPIDANTANKVLDRVYTKKWELPNGKKLTDFDRMIMELDKPENHHIKLKIALLSENNWDLTKVQKRAISKETGGLFARLKGKEIKQEIKTKPADDDWND